MLLFNIFSLQFTAVFLLFYKSAGTRSIKFLLTFVEISGHNVVEHFYRSFCFLVICSVVQTNENYLEVSLGCMANAVAVPSSSFQFS